MGGIITSQRHMLLMAAGDGELKIKALLGQTILPAIA